MREWKDEENYRPQRGNIDKALGFMLVGSVTILVAYTASIIMEFVLSTPKVAP